MVQLVRNGARHSGLRETVDPMSVPAYILWIASGPYLVSKQKAAARHPAHPAKSPRRLDSPAKKENRPEKLVDFSVFSNI